MAHVEKQKKVNLTYRSVLFTCFAAYCYSAWLSLVLANYLPFAQAENVYLAVFIGFIFFIFYVILTSAISSKRWFWIINILGVLLLTSDWLFSVWGVA
ncbi:MAG: hypothetical protein RR575_01830 [Acinetobacter sp.]